MHALPELTLPFEQATALAEACAPGGLVDLEVDLLGARATPARLTTRTDWVDVRTRVAALWRDRDHVVVRGLPQTPDGASGLLFAALLGAEFRTYKGDRIVKHFRLSPWTTALSHTLADGHFHTDINTADEPPAATSIQCIEPDPGGPAFGQLRVARLPDLLAALAVGGHARALRFLMEDRVVMANDATDAWTGQVVEAGRLRFHPETLRAAQRRYATNPPDLEACLALIHDAALAVSAPIALERGDLLLVSNRRALHYRSACTVRFRTFPRDFETRTVAVLHTREEPA